MMSLAGELSALYQLWRTLTEDEGEAIASEAWNDVEQCQNAKSRIQPRIVEVSRRLTADAHDRQFRPVVNALMELERRNSALLRDKRQSADRQKESLDRSSRHLRQLHKSYVPPAKAHWHSYS